MCTQNIVLLVCIQKWKKDQLFWNEKTCNCIFHVMFQNGMPCHSLHIYVYVYMLYVQTNIIQKYVCTSGTQHIQTKYKIMQYKMKYELKCSCYLF